MGRLSNEITPAITIRIEITMATIGRLMKNFAIVVPRRSHKRLGTDRSASDFHEALNDNLFAWLQSFGNDPVRADPISHLDDAKGRLVAGSHYDNLVHGLDSMTADWAPEGPFFQPGQEADPTKSPRTKQPIRVGKLRRRLDGAGLVATSRLTRTIRPFLGKGSPFA